MPRKKAVGESEDVNEVEDTPIPVEDEVTAEITQPVPEEAKEEPKPFEVESLSGGSTMKMDRLPGIRSCVCTFCGPGEYDPTTSPMQLKVDWRVDPNTQIGRCQHYKGVRIRCSFCPLTQDWRDNLLAREHFVWRSPYDPNKLLICCVDMNCRTKWYKLYQGQK